MNNDALKIILELAGSTLEAISGCLEIVCAILEPIVALLSIFG